LELTYKRVLGVNLVLHVLIGIYAVAAPAGLSLLVGLPAESTLAWLRAWGGMLLLVTLLYLPGMLHPARIRWPNIVGILGRFGMALLFLLIALLGGEGLRGFLWFALFDAGFAITLALLYLRLLKAELMSRP
jgi:hypothetical protein